MGLENIHGSENNLYQLVEGAQKSSEATLESIGKGFAFPVAEEVLNATDRDIRISEDGESISRNEIFKVALHALNQAWENAIKPRIEKIRNETIESDKLKSGVDFFTEADVESEKIMREIFFEQFGENSLRIFGEEENGYLGNEKSSISIRIDPIDGTESMKFGKQDWGVMVGIYEDGEDSEKQIASAVYYPEKEALVYGMEDAGVFITDLASAETKKIEPIKNKDEIGDVITQVWRHSDVEQRGDITAIENSVSNEGGRIRSTTSACTDVLEALSTKGARIMIIDGDFNQVDFIPHPLLTQLGYRIYDWDGTEYDPDDVSLVNKKLVIVPPGNAGELVREIIKESSSP